MSKRELARVEVLARVRSKQAAGGRCRVPALLGWGVHQPLIFASLGPTAYERVEQPQIRRAKVYNIIVGHLVGLGAGFLSVFVLNAWSEPASPLPWQPRCWYRWVPCKPNGTRWR